MHYLGRYYGDSPLRGLVSRTGTRWGDHLGRSGDGIGTLACARRVTAASPHAPRCSLTLSSSRFPVVSGFRVVWDSRRPPGQRVISVHLDPEIGESTIDTPTLSPAAAGSTINATQDPAEEVKREKGGRMYRVVTREYLASGHDGYEMLKGNKYLIEDEAGQMMSTVVRKYLLGESAVNSSLQKWLKHVASHRITVCKPNVPPGEREYTLPDFHASRDRDYRSTGGEAVPATPKQEGDALEARGFACDQIDQIQEALPGDPERRPGRTYG